MELVGYKRDRYLPQTRPHRAMLQDSVGAGRNSGYYPQGFGTPGNAGGPLGGMHGGMGIGQPAQRTGRPRATSNIGMQGNQNQASGISQWQNNVQASQAPPPASERSVHQRHSPLGHG
jgi:hypothetical protein